VEKLFKFQKTRALSNNFLLIDVEKAKPVATASGSDKSAKANPSLPLPVLTNPQK
jgi:hypothetical protein